MKEWIRSKLIKFLGIDSLRELLDLEIKVLTEKHNKLVDFTYETHKIHTDNEEILSDQVHNLNQLYSVGVDVGIREHRNWAVICMEGRPEYVQFVDLGRQDVREVQQFLKRFKGSRNVVDAPIGLMDMWYDQGMLKKR